ncbi:2OG-Fe(II) oxygenase [bacterium]|jgi:prolyl 4-hydroxylase|nr:2OG-Fe(II) oxygenase [bacterium]
MLPSFIEEYELNDKSICNALLGLYQEGYKRGLTNDGVVGDSDTVDHSTKKSVDFPMQEAGKLGPAEMFKWPDYHTELCGFIDQYLEKYQTLKFAGKLEMKQLPQIQCYEPGDGFYKWHCDGTQLSCDRALVYMTYLNDVPDGGTEFMHQEITTKAVKGKTVIWPAGLTHIHRGQIAKEDTKYIITGWLWWDNTK